MAKFIMSKNFIPVIIAMTGLGIFLSYQSHGRSDNEDPKSKHAKVMYQVGTLLEDGHFSPKKIDDAFSKQVLKKFAQNLDDEKVIFLRSDVDKFRKFDNKIDDEIHKGPLVSFYEINEVYIKRRDEVANLYPKLLEKPFDFNVDEKIQMDAEKYDYPKNEHERSEMWRKRLKYAVLGKFVDMQEDREKNKDKKDFVYKQDSTLEREARETVKKQMDRYFSTKKTRETEDENFSTFINTITGLMDPHTNYFPPIDLRSFNESMSGRFFGIGAQLKEDDGKIKISSLVSGGPAWKSREISENDEIIKVGQGNQEPVDVTGYAVSDAVKLIRGAQKGSEVRLTLRKTDGSIKVVSLLRDDIKLEDTFAKSAVIKGKNKIGYIYLPEFYADFERPNGARCAVDVAKELEKLKAEKVDGIILDLRGNGGGSLYDVVQMVGLFIPNGPVCQVKGRDEKPSILRDRDDRVQYDGPLAVMVDGGSASASEIFAAAIQDYQRGIIIGSSSTYGKGTVQRSIPLGNQTDVLHLGKNEEELGNVKLTLQKFYRINGGATQQRGVIPDIILPDRYDYLKFREKDNPISLPWDEIAVTDYTTWKSDASLRSIILSENEEVKNNTVFNSIKTNVEWLEKYMNKDYSLQLNKYKDDQKQLKEISKRMEELNKLSQSMNFSIPAADTAIVNSAEDKIEKNKQWIKFRSNDVYIDETIKTLDKVILQNNLVSSEIKRP